MNQEKRIKDLRFILNNKNINLNFREDLLKLLNLVEDNSENQNKDFILEVTEKMLDFLLKESLSVASSDIIKKSCLIINNLNLNEKKINRNAEASLLILNQDIAIRDAVGALRVIIRKTEEYKKTTPKSYQLSEEYFKNY